MKTENGFWEYGNLWRNGRDRDFVRYAATEPSPENKECDLCVDNSNNNSSKMADNNKKKPPEDAPEIKMVKPGLGQSISIQFLLLIITKQPSVKELSTDKPNTSKEKTLTNGLTNGSIFDKDRFNTEPKQHNQSKREAENGNDINDDKTKSARDGMRRGTFRRTEQFKHNIFSLACEHFNLILEIFSYGMQGKFMDSKRWL